MGRRVYGVERNNNNNNNNDNNNVLRHTDISTNRPRGFVAHTEQSVKNFL
jgi:hypothetical protein